MAENRGLTLESLKDHEMKLEKVCHMDNGDAWSYFESMHPIYDGWLSGWIIKGRARGRAIDPGPHVLARDTAMGMTITRLGHLIPITVGELVHAYEHVAIWAWGTNRIFQESMFPMFSCDRYVDIKDDT